MAGNSCQEPLIPVDAGSDRSKGQKESVGNDAICFTAGLAGATFSAGTIHAYLAADRNPPAVVAGISTGALSAAAMQESYRVLFESRRQKRPPAEQEAARWAWFRKYLHAISEQPLNVFWNAIPDQSDFFAEMVPIRDTSTPGSLQPDEIGARRQLYLLVKLGRWLARLPVTFQMVASYLVAYVRSKEKYPLPQKTYSWAMSWVWRLRMLMKLLDHVCLSPEFFPEHRFVVEQTRVGEPERSGIPLPRRGLPVLCWVNLVSLSLAVVLCSCIALAVLFTKVPRGLSEALQLAVKIGGFLITILILSSLTAGFRRRLMRARPVERWLFPLFGWVIYGFSWLNLIYFILTLFLGFWILLGVAKVIELNAGIGIGFFIAVGFLVLPWVLLVPFALIPETRHWLVERRFLALWPRPLLGWEVYSFLWLHVILLLLFDLAWFRLAWFRALRQTPMHGFLWSTFLATAVLLAAAWLMIAPFLFIPKLRFWLAARILAKVDLRKGLIHDFQLRLKLTQLFDPLLKGRKLQEDPMPILVVAAPLQTLFKRENSAIGGQTGVDTGGPVKNAPKKKRLAAYQLLARKGTPLIEALRTALAIPPMYPPTHLETARQIRNWMSSPEMPRELDLVDGAVIRQNPLPALFTFLQGRPALANQLSENNGEDSPAIHVIYRVPIEARIDQGGLLPEDKTNIVDVALASKRLSARRDTQMEVEQTNFISRLEKSIRAHGSTTAVAQSDTFPIFADEIAPETDLTFKNPLNPHRDEILTAVAAGCRRTLEVLYRTELREQGSTRSEVECDSLLVTLAGRSREFPHRKTPGLPEVCEHCPRKLKRPVLEPLKGATIVATQEILGDAKDFSHRFRKLTGAEPRIAFVASGGVFRGAFHIGMLAALKKCKIKPDLIVGTSVGTLMAGALGAMFCSEANVLGRLVETFLHVDDQVALTKTLKGAARELGLRGSSIRLSPREVRRLVRRGSRSDPGFAAAGAPSALIDAISDLFMIPHRKTSQIAAEFIVGHVTHATNALLGQLKRETLRRLGIEQAVIGASLLEPVSRDLLSGLNQIELTDRQPYMKREIAFFGTTTNLGSQTPLLLGGDGLYAGVPFDFVEAALSSSAFPAIFEPRRESGIFLGTGRDEVRFADGGMFDNLPFIPAITILSWAQRGYRMDAGHQLSPYEFLENRNKCPDLIIAGALNVAPESDREGQGPFDTLLAIARRSSSLQHNVKIRSFEYAARRVHRQVERYLSAQPNLVRSAGTCPVDFIDHVVDATVLPVFPASREHLNGTFAFCASTGLRKTRVLKSIADGCFQTLRALAEKQQEQDFTGETVQKFVNLKRMARLDRRDGGDTLKSGSCPFFKISQEGKIVPFECPFVSAGRDSRFAESKNVYDSCRGDSVHSKYFSPAPLE